MCTMKRNPPKVADEKDEEEGEKIPTIKYQ